MPDRNLFFQLLNSNRQQGKLERPSLRGNYIPKRENKDEPYWGNSIYQNYQEIHGGADKNLFFKMQEKGKARLVPFMLRRQFKDLDPKTRIMESLDTTRGERQATALVKGIQNISSLLNAFLSEPETDAAGNPILDSEGKPKLKKISLSDKLTVAHDAVREMFKQAQVPINNNQDKIISMLGVDDSKSMLSDATSIASHDSWEEASQEEKSDILHDKLLDEAVSSVRKEGEEKIFIKPPEDYKEDEELETPEDPVEKSKMTELALEILERNPDKTGNISEDQAPTLITAVDYNSFDDNKKNEIFNYLIIRKHKQNKVFRSRAGKEVPDSKLATVMAQNFRRENTLDIDNMTFIKKV